MYNHTLMVPNPLQQVIDHNLNDKQFSIKNSPAVR